MDGRRRDKKMKKKKEVEGVGEFKEGSARGQCRGRGEINLSKMWE